MKNLWAPWRYEWLAAPRKGDGCFLCRAAATREDRDALVVARSERALVLLNLYPYANGHVMIAPREHAATPADVDAATRGEIMDLLVAVQGALHDEYRPDGLNVGLNLGRAAGAGVADHFHVHVVPRWSGDTNFLTVAAETRVLSETLATTWRKLRSRLSGAPPAGARRKKPSPAAARRRARR